MSSVPPDPMTTLTQGAVQIHEVFHSLQRAGFSAQEALYLVGQMVRPQPPASA